MLMNVLKVRNNKDMAFDNCVFAEVINAVKWCFITNSGMLLYNSMAINQKKKDMILKIISFSYRLKPFTLVAVIFRFKRSVNSYANVFGLVLI